MWRQLDVPPLAGKRVLDVGANDGWFSFRAERCGASEVWAVDLESWGNLPTGKAGFNYVHKMLGSKVKSAVFDVQERSILSLGKFDCVFCLGLLYHLRHPLSAIENIHGLSASGALVFVEALALPDGMPDDCMQFLPSGFNGDASTHWRFGASCLQGMFRGVGFTSVTRLPARPGRCSFVCRNE